MPTNLTLFWFIILTIWVFGPALCALSLWSAFRTRRSRWVWIMWSILAVLNVPGVFILTHWGLMMAMPYFDGKPAIVTVPIVVPVMALAYALLFCIAKREKRQDRITIC